MRRITDAQQHAISRFFTTQNVERTSPLFEKRETPSLRRRHHCAFTIAAERGDRESSFLRRE